MKWTIDKPVEPGWYWWRLNDEAEIEMLLVYKQGTYLMGRLCGYTPQKLALKLSKAHGQFLGPITSQEDAP